MNKVSDQTMMFQVEAEEKNAAAVIITTVYQALKEKGYNPINQLVGYLISGDPTYITSYNNARGLIRQLERDELLEELVRAYLKEE
ncbi:MAG: IreB family regulatory phosphoprotein [Sporomusaceae bacterium]|nr:IreB family regulatory phosphoprotein [Sporomusaceae bacterium]